MLICITLLCIQIKAQQRKGYAQFQIGAFFAKDYRNPVSLNGGAGIIMGNVVSVGTSVDFYPFKQSQLLFIPKGDIRGFINGAGKKTAVFISLQPGYAIAQKTSSSLDPNAGFAFDAMIGFIGSDPGKGGVTMSAGYSQFTIKNGTRSTKTEGFKITAGMSF